MKIEVIHIKMYKYYKTLKIHFLLTVLIHIKNKKNSKSSNLSISQAGDV